MSYKIAVASSDGVNIDETFGSAKEYIIYEVEDSTYRKLENRAAAVNEAESISDAEGDKCSPSGSCGNGGGFSGGNGGGCGGAVEVSAKVELISDCRCIVCKKIGFHAQKQLERKAISSFDVSCSVKEALSKISNYFSSIDNHRSLRKG